MLVFSFLCFCYCAVAIYVWMYISGFVTDVALVLRFGFALLVVGVLGVVVCFCSL